MRRPVPGRQRGAATILAVVFLVISVSLMVLAALNMAGSDITDTAMTSDAIEALFIAESGIEHAAHAFASGTACLDLAPVGPVAFGRGQFQVTDAGTTDFLGAALPASQCRITVRGQAGARDATRRIEAILRAGGNLLANDNADFNDPEGAPGPPDGWSLSPGGWDDGGGPDGSRSAYISIDDSGKGDVNTAGAFGLTSFTVTAPTTLSMEFDYRVLRSPAGGPPNEMQLTFELLDSDGNTYTHTEFKSGHTGSYTADSVDIEISGSGQIDITTLKFDLVAKSGKAKQIWLDNLVLTDPNGGGGNIALMQWREQVQ